MWRLFGCFSHMIEQHIDGPDLRYDWLKCVILHTHAHDCVLENQHLNFSITFQRIWVSHYLHRAKTLNRKKL